MTDLIDATFPTRVIGYAGGDDLNASRSFYTEVLGFDVAMEDPVLGLTSPANPTAQVLIPPAGFEDSQPRFGIDLGDPQAVTAAHAAALQRGLRVVYPLTDEPWGVRRFFVEDPGGTIINVLAHTVSTTAGIRPRLVVEDVDAAVGYYERYLGATRGSAPRRTVRPGRARRTHDRDQHDLAHPGPRRLPPLLAAIRGKLTRPTDADGRRRLRGRLRHGRRRRNGPRLHRGPPLGQAGRKNQGPIRPPLGPQPRHLPGAITRPQGAAALPPLSRERRDQLGRSAVAVVSSSRTACGDDPAFHWAAIGS